MASVSETLQSALKFHQADDLPRAENLYRQILRIDPKQADALHLLGVAALQQGRNESALDLINRAIAVNGKAAPYHNNLGTVSRRLGRIDLATECFRTAIELSPDYADAHYNLGTLLKEQGQLQQALESFRETLRINPNYAEAHNNLGTVWKDLGRIDEAVECYRRALEIDPNSPEAHNNLGTALQEQENRDAAIECHRRAIALSPDYAEAHFNLANIFRDQDRLNEAFASYQQALDIEPDHAEALCNFGLVQMDLGKPDDAISTFRRVLQMNPAHVESHINLGIALRLTGDLEAGFEEYEWRWEAEKQRRCFTQPLWDGTSLVDGTLLVYSEQGVGDEIFFASCMGDVLKKTPNCLVECDPRLVELYSRSFPKAQVIALTPNARCGSSVHLPDFDVQIPIGSLPRLFRRSLDSIPQRRSYLVPDTTLQEKWKKRFAELGDSLKVGISWRGGKQEISRRRRTTTLDQWEAILSLPGVAFVNLQYGDCVEELEAVHRTTGVQIHDWDDADPLVDLDGFAAQISALDMVISIDNSTVHMAGALGVNVWTLLPFSPDWRWFLNRNDSPWYPSMRLFRQSRIGEWDAVFNNVTNALGDRMKKTETGGNGRIGSSLPAACGEAFTTNQKSSSTLNQKFSKPKTIVKTVETDLTEIPPNDADEKWLNDNRQLRMDAHRPCFKESRREFHLSRYQFATQYCEEKRVLDAACGTGYGSALLAESAIEVRGIDACLRTIDYAQRHYGNEHLKFHKSRVERIPFDEGYFDVVVSFETIEHTISPRWVMQEFARVLRADGTAVLSIPNSWGLTPHHFVDFDLPQLRELTEHFFEEQQYFYNNSGDIADRTPLGIGPLETIDPQHAECILAVCRRPRKECIAENRLENLLDELYENAFERHHEFF
ncbi:MAG: tetratricopeptide repeat protein, partial [Planctomycetes bacterium]|nr:tetratricopeptide repeat protein [Planctomycetota bacterium]